MSKENAEQLLNSVMQDEKDVQDLSLIHISEPTRP